MNQADARPTRKVLTGAIAGILTAALTQILGRLGPGWLDFLETPEVASGLPVIVTFAASYVVRDMLHIPDEQLDEIERLLL